MTRYQVVFAALAVVVSGRTLDAAPTVTKIMDHGPDGEKLTFVVMGDGYASSDQSAFANDVGRLVIDGVFGHDFYKDNVSAFNVYRVNLVSNESGVSHPLFAKDTALGVIYSGDWNRCWLEESDSTDQLINQAASKVQKYDYVLIIANEPGYGGCRRGSRLYITSGDSWDVVAHEYGHGIANLFDEYSVAGTAYTGDRLNIRNCSTVPPANALTSLVWKTLVGPSIPLPTDNAPGIDPNQTVGMFTGCNYSATGIYRPVQACRMQSVHRGFCPVCLRGMQSAVKQYLAASASPPQPGRAQAGPPTKAPAPPAAGTYLNLVLRVKRTGDSRVLQSNEVKGNVRLFAQASPSFFFAILKNGRPTGTALLPENPYLVRGFADPEHREKGESLKLVDEATIIVNVPKTDMAGAARNLGLQLFRVTAAAQENPPAATATQGADLMNFFKGTDFSKVVGLVKMGDLPSSVLHQAMLRDKGNTAPRQ